MTIFHCNRPLFLLFASLFVLYSENIFSYSFNCNRHSLNSVSIQQNIHHHRLQPQYRRFIEKFHFQSTHYYTLFLLNNENSINSPTQSMPDPSESSESSIDSLSRLIDNIGSSAKGIIITTASSIVLFSPNSWMPIYYCSMSFLSSSISKTIKNTLRWPRPIGSPEEGYGMPSSHSQAFFFWFTTITLKLLVFNEDRNILSYLLCPTFGAYCFMASYWRVKIRLHSIAQTIAGALFGSTIAYLSVTNESQLLEKLSQFMTKQFPTSSDSDPLVPLWLRAMLVGVGSVILHYPEIGDSLKKRWQKKQD